MVKDENQIWEWATKLSKLGNKKGTGCCVSTIIAPVAIGDIYMARGYLFGWGVEKDELKGYQMVLPFAESGDPLAMACLDWIQGWICRS